MPKLFLASSLVSLFVSFSLADEAWTRFRGPNGSGISLDKGFPSTLDKDRNAVWRTPVRPGKSSPVLTTRHIFLTGYDEGKLFTQCFDRKTGKLLWERSVEPRHTGIVNRLNQAAAPTPVTDGENVYSFFKDFGLVSYDSRGALRWQTPLEPFNNTQGVATSPIIAGGNVIILADQWENSYIAGFTLAKGEMRFKSSRGESEGWATPLLYQGQIVTVSRGMLGLHQSSDGKRTATLPGLAIAIVGSPVLDQQTVYAFGYGVETSAPFAPRLQRLDKNGDGKLSPEEYGDDAVLHSIGRNAGNRDGIVVEAEFKSWAEGIIGPNALHAISLSGEKPRELWRYEKNFTSVIPSTLAYQNVLYIVRNGGILTSHDTATGAVIKAARLPQALGGYSASPVAAEAKIYLASEDGKVSVVTAGGDWEPLSVTDIGESCYATPALSNGVVYLRTDQALYAFRE
ncbi:MAG: PQQ-binding-like beta-propeller repeat protein [Bryobacterales bacterium]|nr:PQQ-binding-like beta-propeller repeat protein [Bryobacterales bacterium]